MPFKLEFVSDVRSVTRGAEQMADTFDKNVDALEELAREGKRTGDQLGKAFDSAGDDAKAAADKIDRELTGAAKEGDQAADKLDRTFRKAFDSVKKDSKQAGDQLGDNVKRGAKEASEGVDTLGENGASNAKELGASFDGTFEGLIDGIQGFVAEATEGFGAVGLVAGVGLAAAVGIGMAALQSAADEANAVTDNAITLGNALADATDNTEAVSVLRDRFNEVADAIGDTRSLWEVWQSRARTQGEQLADAIKQGSLSAADLNDAFSDPDPVSRMDALRRVQDQLNDSIAKSTDEYNKAADGTLIARDAVENWVDANADAAAAAKANMDVSKAAKDVVDAEIATQEAAVAILEAKAAALGKTVPEYQAAEAAADSAKQVQESFNDAIESAGDSVSVYEGVLERKAAAEGKSVEDTTVTVDEMIAEWQRQADEAKAFEANLALIAANGGQALADELRAKGPEAASATADLLAKASPDQQRAAFAAWGSATGQGMGQGTADGIRSKAGEVQAGVDYLRQGIRTPAPVPVGVELPTQEQLQADLDRKVRALRPGTIKLPAVVGVERPV